MTARSLWMRFGTAARLRWKRATTRSRRPAPAVGWEPEAEDAIAESIVTALEREARFHADCRVVKIGVRVGELCRVESRRLQRAFQEQLSASDVDGVALEIEPCPRRNRCVDCEHEYTVVGSEEYCPSCGSEAVRQVGGDELELTFLEVEER